MRIDFMNRIVTVVSLCLSLLLSMQPALAQLDATYPLNRMIFQRNNANKAVIQVAGSFTTVLDRVEVQVVNRVTSTTVTSWTTVQANPTNGQFAGSLTLVGGWYQLNFRGIRNNAVVGTDVIDRVGVGEVFAILGHSNAQGTSCGDGTWTYNGPNLCETLPGSIDDRVSCAQLNSNNSAAFSNPAFVQYEETADNRYLPGLTAFSRLDTYTGPAPFAKLAWYWGKLGDQLVAQLGVPVLFYNAGFGGTTMEQVYKSAYDIPFSHSFVRYDLRMPYVNVRNIMNLYVPATGLRAVLVQHGVNERDNEANVTQTNYLGVIDKVRTEFNLPSLAWVIAKDSYITREFPNPRQAQEAVINRGEWASPRFVDHIYRGPDLDAVTMLNPADPNVAWRPDGLHYSPAGQQQVANRWTAVLGQQALLDSMIPVLPQPQPMGIIACPGSTTGLSITFPAGYTEYNWGDVTSSQSRTVGAGSYTVRLRAPSGRIFFPPAITVADFTAPAQPTVSALGSSADLCSSSSLTLTTNATSPVRWSTSQTSATIAVTSAGTYSAQATDLVYGCLSAPGTFTVGLGQADLSLNLAVDRRVLKVDDEVQYALTITNKGPCDPGSLSWQNRLPPNVQYISSASAISVTNNILSSTLASGLPPNTSVTQRFRVRVQQPGTYLNAAQIMSAGKTDPNSMPGSGTGDGQDDASVTDVRTTESSTAVFVSPNPDQVPLPTVKPNQPVSDTQTADLSLAVSSSQRVVRLNGLVSFSLVVSNRGGAAASNVVVVASLPAGLTYTSSASGMTFTNNVVRGIINSIPPGTSATLTFVATPTTPGLKAAVTQVAFADPADPDSVPGNGYDNGEDDTARAEIRVEN